MKKACFTSLVIFLFVTTILAKSNPELNQKAVLCFTENKGQVHDQNYEPRPDVLFGVMAGNMAVHIKKTGVSYQLYRVDSYKETEDFQPKDAFLILSKGKRKEIDQQTIYRIDLTWLNASAHGLITKDVALTGYNNYYLENCPSGVLNVKSYKGITLHNLYNGINLHYYEKNGELKHDYIVAPHANYKQIQLKVEGAEISVNEEGFLILTTPLGKVQEGAPVVFQNGKQLKSRWQINNNILSFKIEDYDPAYELIIDPITRLWGTYYGGGQGSNDTGLACATDAEGNIYLAGYTSSNTGTAIATSGSHQSSHGGAYHDGFLAKLNANGVRQWGTYYGGSGGDVGHSCATDINGNIYLVGQTTTSVGTTIATSGSHQSAYGGGTYDGFLVKFNTNGVRQWATYYGGSGVEWPFGCATDASGNVYMSGYTESNTGTVIASTGSHQSTHGGGTYDSYLVKFNASGTRQWATYYGGSNPDYGYSCATDVNGNVFLTGVTSSSVGTVMATTGSHQPLFGGWTDAFLVKFDSAGNRLWATYYGDANSQGASFCATDAAGNLFMTGSTDASTGTVIATTGSHQSTHAGGAGGSDAYLVKFDSNGNRQWGTFYGGIGTDYGSGCATDAGGNVYLTGQTNSNAGTVIATVGSHQPAYGGGTNWDAFLVKFNSVGVRESGTFYGGTGGDQGYACATTPAGYVYMVGITNHVGGTVIATSGSHQSSYGGGQNCDSFIAKFDGCDVAPLQPSVINGPSNVCSGRSATFSTPLTYGANTYTWSLPSGWSGANSTNTISTIPGITGIFTLVAGNSCGVSPQQTISVNVLLSPSITISGGTICKGETFTLTPGGAVTYTYSSGQIVSPNNTTSYSVTGTGTNGCVSSNTAIATITVNPLPIVSASTNITVICVGEQATLTANGAASYTFYPGGTGASITVSPNITSTYTITGTGTNGCSNTTTITQNVDECVGIANVASGASATKKLFPNPTSGILNVELDSDNKVIIVNNIGEIVYSVELISGKHRINIENLPAGIYMVKIENAGYTKTIKLIKE